MNVVNWSYLNMIQNTYTTIKIQIVKNSLNCIYLHLRLLQMVDKNTF